jgi:anti-anti-sigma factor
MRFKIDCSRAGDGTAVVRLIGEVDMSVEERFRAALCAAIVSAPSAVVVDLGDLTFLDCAGVRVLLESHRLARAATVPLTIHNPRPLVLRVLRALGVSEELGLTGAMMSSAANGGQPRRLTG